MKDPDFTGNENKSKKFLELFEVNIVKVLFGGLVKKVLKSKQLITIGIMLKFNLVSGMSADIGPDQEVPTKEEVLVQIKTMLGIADGGALPYK